jgi:hypothetical protein
MTTKAKPHTTVTVTALPTCDFCGEPAHADGKTQMGPWANMCQLHFAFYGVGYGLGKGQRYVLRKEEK